MWLYTLLRFGMFFALWGLLWLARVPSLLAATIALILSIPLSYILLRKQRARLAANLEARVNARQAQRHDLDAKLSGTDDIDRDGIAPDDIDRDDIDRDDIDRDDIDRDNVDPDGIAPDGIAPDGIAPDGIAPDGIDRDNVDRDGIAPDGERRPRS